MDKHKKIKEKKLQKSVNIRNAILFQLRIEVIILIAKNVLLAWGPYVWLTHMDNIATGARKIKSIKNTVN